MKSIYRRVENIEKKLKVSGKPVREDVLPVTMLEHYVLLEEWEVDYKAHPENYSQEDVNKLKAQKEQIESIFAVGYAIDGWTEEDERREQEKTQKEIEAIRERRRNGDLRLETEMSEEERKAMVDWRLSDCVGKLVLPQRQGL